MKTFPVPTCTITFNSVTSLYAFATRFEGKPEHDRLDTFTSVENVLAWVDPQGERIREPASDADESKILVSERTGRVPFRGAARVYPRAASRPSFRPDSGLTLLDRTPNRRTPQLRRSLERPGALPSADSERW
jgi:hypothetical protein